MKSLLLSTFLALLVCLLTSGSALAQTELSGTVTDSAGAVVAKATVTIKSLDNGAMTTSKTNAQGAFLFPFVAPGAYSVQVDATGYPHYASTTYLRGGVETTVHVKLGKTAAKQ